jgi:hypothetical protein
MEGGLDGPDERTKDKETRGPEQASPQLEPTRWFRVRKRIARRDAGALSSPVQWRSELKRRHTLSLA